MSDIEEYGPPKPKDRLILKYKDSAAIAEGRFTVCLIVATFVIGGTAFWLLR